jgi:HD-GYP domain-containing protein (c-di-GMP phosphodiesterase class II)
MTSPSRVDDFNAAHEPPSVTARLDAAKLAEREGRWVDACAEYEALIRDEGAILDTRLAALRWLGRAHLESGNRTAAMEILQVAVTAAEQAGRPRAIAQALNVVAIAEQIGGNLDSAAELYAAARARAQQTEDRALQAMIDQNVGTVASIRGDTPAALTAFRLSLVGYQILGLRNYQGQVLNNMGLAYLELGELTAAESAYAEAGSAFLESGDRANELTVAVNQVQLWIAMKRFDKALAASNQLLALGEGGPQPWIGEVYRHLGVIAREKSEYDKASAYLQLAERHAGQTEDLLLSADVAEQRAELHWVEQRHREMLTCLNRARGIYSQLNAEKRVAQVERRNAALEQRFFEIAKRWGDSIEGKDHYTQGHCERVADLACILAVRAGIDERSMFWFRLGALLHDVGKIIVPFEVLNKPGPLTNEEWALMKLHPQAGLDLIADIDFPGDVRAMIRSHHERWDGTGYPDGLVGETTPLPARILRIADVYDALTSTRGYRSALPHERAIELMREEGQFDPQLFEIFIEWTETQQLSSSGPHRIEPDRGLLASILAHAR